jgi:hypothetical protein
VLVGLGRIAAQHGDATALAMADKVTDGAARGVFKTTREAASWLRHARLSVFAKPPQASAVVLERLVITTVNNYLVDHADILDDTDGASEELVRRAKG